MVDPDRKIAYNPRFFFSLLFFLAPRFRETTVPSLCNLVVMSKIYTLLLVSCQDPRAVDSRLSSKGLGISLDLV